MSKSLAFDFYYGGEAEQYSFYRIPRALIVEERFRGVSNDAKLLYGLMLDRMGLSLKNGWMDESGKVFVYFSLDDIQKAMGCAHQKACKLLAELDTGKGIGLIELKKQGQGKPAKIYVKRFYTQDDRPEPPQVPPPPPTDDLKTEPQNANKGKSALPFAECAERPASSTNYTYSNQTYPSQLYPSIHPPLPPLDGSDGYDRRNDIREQIGYEQLLVDYGQEEMDELVELLMDVYCATRPTIRVGGEDRPTRQVLERLKLLDCGHVRYVEDCLSASTNKIRNIRAYLLTAIYNAPATMGRYYQAEAQHDLYGGL